MFHLYKLWFNSINISHNEFNKMGTTQSSGFFLILNFVVKLLYFTFSLIGPLDV